MNEKRKGRLKGLIYQLGVTQREFSLDVEIPEGRLSQIITGAVEATSREKTTLAHVLGVKVSEIFPESNVEPLKRRSRYHAK